MAGARPSQTWYGPLAIGASLVVVVAALALARPILVPIVLAVLLTFVLSPLVLALQRLRLGRIVSVLLVVMLAFAVIGGISAVVLTEMKSLAAELPQRKGKIVEKIGNLRTATKASWLDSVYDTMDDIAKSIKGEDKPPSSSAARPHEVVTTGKQNSEPGPSPQEKGAGAGATAEEKSAPGPSPQEGVAGTGGKDPDAGKLPANDSIALPPRVQFSFLPLLQSVAAPVIEGLASTILVIVLVVFMLIQREDLRNRFIRLIGSGSLINMTKAVDDGTQRISRFLLMQLLVNTGFGILFAAGLAILGMPYAVLWGFLAGALRYVPYIGSWAAASLSILWSIVVLDGWTQPLLVLVLFVALEVLTWNVVEPWLFGHSIGASAVALLVSAAFWAWLWGPVGLILSAPLTACLVVLGRYVPALEFFSVLLGDEPVLEPHVTYYQRLLAHDVDEAAAVVDDFVETHSADEVCDQVIVPALILAKENRDRGEMTPDEERLIFKATQEIVEEALLPKQAAEQTAASQPERDEEASGDWPVLVFGCPGHDAADELALSLFARFFDPSKCRFKVMSSSKLTAEIISQIEEERPALVCIAALPPRGLVHARYLCKRLRAQLPEQKIFVGCWGLKENIERIKQRWLAAGADKVMTTMLETRAAVLPFIQAHAHIQRWEPAGSHSS
jgi:predicted PurR-regulated permease PerM